MSRITTFIKENWGLMILTPLLVVIIVVNLHPDFFLAGWDNFSGTTDLSLNLKRSIFLVYRSFRGFGVQSDSEVVDIARLMLLSILSPFIRNELLDQIYLMGSLFTGVVFLYFLAKEVYRSFFNERFPEKKLFYLEITAITAAFFYLFNLNTLATFYTPIVMFTARFWFYPVTLWLVLKIVKKGRFTLPTFISFVLVSLLGATSYLTATVFIVLLFILVVVLFFMNNPLSTEFRKSLKISLLVGFTFVMINLFWFLPFLNYALSKSEAVTYTTNNVFINQHVLNGSPAKFTPYRVFTMFPDILDLSGPTDMETGSAVDIYTNRDLLLEDSLIKVLLLTFSALAIFGSILIIFHGRKYTLLFIPVLVFFTYFVLFKDRPPLGFIFDAFATYIPFFEEIFRFGETKFMPVLALFGSLAAGFAVYFWVRILSLGSKGWLGKTIALVIVSIFIFIPQLYTFQSYFQGDLTWNFLYVDIPDEYRSISDVVDDDKETQMVLHLPFDEFSYWRVHSWGYFGSSFLNYQMESPLMDRTFEPGSFENDDLLQSIQSSVKKDDKDGFIEGIENAGIDYLIFDESVQESIDSRGVTIWGKYHAEDLKMIFDQLETEGKIEAIKTETIDIEAISKKYGAWDELSESVRGEMEPDSLILYKVIDHSDDVEVISEATRLDEQVSPLRKLGLLEADTRYIQSGEHNLILMPFLLDNKDISAEKTHTILDTNSEIPSETEFAQPSKELVSIHMRKVDGSVEIALQKISDPLNGDTEVQYQDSAQIVKISSSLIPEIDESIGSVEQYNSDWHIIEQNLMNELSKYRVSVGDMVLPLPSSLPEEFTYMTSVLVDGGEIEVILLTPKEQFFNLIDTLEYTENPNCVGDESEKHYLHDLRKIEGEAVIESEYGSTCVTAYLNQEEWQIYPYYETELSFNLALQEVEQYEDPYDNPLYNDEGSDFHQFTTQNEKAIAESIYLMDEATYLRYCYIDAQTLGCMNTHQLIGSGKEETTVLIPNAYINDSYNAQILFTLPSWGYNRSIATISELVSTGFEGEEIVSLDLAEIPDYSDVAITGTHRISIPKTLSHTSYYMGTKFDRLQTNIAVCDLVGAYRTTRVFEGATISYIEACDNFLSVYNNYDPSSLYLWNTSYNVLAGKSPSYYFYPYLDDFLSRYSQIGRIDTFGELEQPVIPLNPLSTSEIELIISEAYMREDYTYLYPESDSSEMDYREFRINHLTGNQGVLKIDQMMVQELPNNWVGSVYREDESQLSGVEASIIRYPIRTDSYKYIVDGISEGGTLILKDGEAYDENWELHENSSFLNILLGGGRIEAEQIRVDGWSNGWIVETSDISIVDGETEFILFYGTLRYMIFGLVAGVVTVLIIGGVVLYKSISKKDVEKESIKTE